MTTLRQCQDRREDIAALVLGELDPTAADQLNQHMNTCKVCRGFRDALADQETVLRSTFGAIARGVGPIEHLVERFDECQDQSKTHAASPFTRLIGGFKTMRLSRKVLAAAAAIAITFTGLASWLIPGRSTTSIVFADVLEQISVFRPYSCLYTWEYEGKPPRSYRLMRPSLSRRREVRPDGTILVFDLSQEPNRTLILNPERRTAVEQTLLNSEPRQDPDFLRILAGMRDGKSDDLGVKEIDGRLAHGFHKPDPINEFTVWADPDTGLPIRIELVHPRLARRLIMTEFEFDVLFDESLFSTMAPEGYRVQKAELDGVNPTEEHLIEGLRAIAAFLDNRFPPTMERQPLKKVIEERVEQMGSAPPDEEMRTLRLEADRAVEYVEILRQFYKVSDLTYAGEGVALGDAATPVLWWKPKATETYRVVYGDLSIRDVPSQDLPTPSTR